MKAIRSKKLAAVGGAERAQGQYNKYVTKYKRTKNLVKKCTDIAKQCDLDIILLIRDKNTDRCREFHTNPALTVDDFIKKLSINYPKQQEDIDKIDFLVQSYKKFNEPKMRKERQEVAFDDLTQVIENFK